VTSHPSADAVPAEPIRRVGFIGLGQLGGKLAGSLVRGGYDVVVLDLDPEAVRPLSAAGADVASSPAEVAARTDLVVTCLPSPAASAMVLEGPQGLLEGLGEGSVWAEMSTTDAVEVRRLAGRVAERGAAAADCPVSGGCHRAESGNISVFAGCDRQLFERLLPVLTTLGRRVLHTGPVGSASVLKVVTNYLASSNLVALTEALATATAAGMDLGTTFEAIRMSSGNSFVHETEGQVILNGSRDIGFTLGLMAKDLDLFHGVAERSGLGLDLSPLLQTLVGDAIDRYGPDEHSPNVIRRLEDAARIEVHADGFPARLVDWEPPSVGVEVAPPAPPERG
jgi:3-hydroxyisobutyrate dehydrogenase